jgi:hypothetical protein
MDQIDGQIIDLLRENGRRSNVEMARVLGISEGTVRKRIERLLSSGVLESLASLILPWPDMRLMPWSLLPSSWRKSSTLGGCYATCPK